MKPGQNSTNPVLPPTTTPFVVINPAAGGGAGEPAGLALVEALSEPYPNLGWGLSSTDRPLGRLTQTALEANYHRIVGVGGDGTHHHILQAILRSGRVAAVDYAHYPAGTGNDWARAHSIPSSMEAWLKMFHRGRTLSHPIGRIRYHAEPNGRERTAYFLNVLGLAYDAYTVRLAATEPPGNQLVYLYTLFKNLRSYVPPTVALSYQLSEASAPPAIFRGPVHTVNLGICPYSGGGMRLVPHADPQRGDLALTIAREVSVGRVLTQSHRFYTGTIGKMREVTTAHVKSLRTLDIRGTLEVEADGEWLGYGPVTVDVAAARLRVVVP